MKSSTAGFLLALAFTSLTATTTHAQWARTWVSATGNDTNPCTRTSPCKTFSGALAKLPVNGEIDVVDAGSFGPVTIAPVQGAPARSVTIDGGGAAAYVDATPNGITIQGAGTVVTLRNLIIAGTGNDGVVVSNAAAVTLEHCEIYGLYHDAIYITGTTSVVIDHCSFHDLYGSGVIVASAAHVSISDTTIARTRGGEMGYPALLVSNASVFVRRCEIVDNQQGGIDALQGSDITVDDSNISFNGLGKRKAAAVSATAGGKVRLSRSVLVGNNGAAVWVLGFGSLIDSFGDNRIAGNGSFGNNIRPVPLH